MNHLRVCVVLVGGAVRLEYDAWMYYGMPCFWMCACHVWWTRVDEVLVGFLRSLTCGVSAWRRSVVLRVSRHVRSCASMPLCFYLGV